MTTAGYQRARSAEAKQQRESAILDAATALGADRGIREVTLTDIAAAVGMHKSAMLRYFETREQIFLRLTALGWHEWSAALRQRLGAVSPAAVSPGAVSPTALSPAAVSPAAVSPGAPPGAAIAAVAEAFADTLVARPMFCDLLAQAPLNLERNVSIESVRSFKLATLTEVSAISLELARLLGLSEQEAVDVIATATSMAGALWQMATPGPPVRELYRSDPRLAHAIVEVGPRLARVLTAMLSGFVGR